jgi:simple sugar transport system permease protein
MLATAFCAASVAVVSGSLVLAVGAAILLGIALSMLHGFACVSHRGDQVVMGMAITMTAAGLTVVLGIAWFNQGGQTPPIPDAVRLDAWFAGLGAALAAIPLFGPIVGGGLLGHTALVYLALVLVAGVWWMFYRTRLGLRWRATGENPAMVDAAGVSVLGMRYLALAGNGVLAALAGCYLVLALNPQFIPNMTAGRGYMALAAMIFGKWHPIGALLACLLFGFLDALAIRLQGAVLPQWLGGGAVPVQAMQALPYVLTVVLLAGFIGRAYAPKALGTPYVKER